MKVKRGFFGLVPQDRFGQHKTVSLRGIRSGREVSDIALLMMKSNKSLYDIHSYKDIKTKI